MRLFLLLLLPCKFVAAAYDSLPKRERQLSLHFQTTAISQYHFDFTPPYTGTNSLLPSEPIRSSLTMTGYMAWKPFRHTYVVFNPEVAGGRGLSQTQGVAGFPNGEVYRVGDPAPKPFIARLLVEQRFPLSNRKEQQNDDQNQVAEKTNVDYLSVILGKFSLTDYFDNSLISHDPRTQFMNWSLMSNGAWDYPANTRGYTLGTVIGANYNNWALRAALTTVPIEANGSELQFKWNKAMGTVIELERTNLFKRNNTRFSSLHIGAFYNKAHMGNYALVNSFPGGSVPDVSSTGQYGRTKWGLYMGMDNHFGKIHQFFKASWSDGKNETWAFTEIDRSFATGIQIDELIRGRKNDWFGAAVVINGISHDHHTYLAKGGYGFIIGDGKLNYGTEQIIETYYSIALSKHFWLTPDYQFIIHPAYNKDRGSVHVVALRLHVEF